MKYFKLFTLTAILLFGCSKCEDLPKNKLNEIYISGFDGDSHLYYFNSLVYVQQNQRDSVRLWSNDNLGVTRLDESTRYYQDEELNFDNADYWELVFFVYADTSTIVDTYSWQLIDTINYIIDDFKWQEHEKRKCDGEYLKSYTVNGKQKKMNKIEVNLLDK